MQSIFKGGRGVPIIGVLSVLLAAMPVAADNWASLSNQGDVVLSDVQRESAPSLQVLHSDTAQLRVGVALDGVALKTHFTKAAQYLRVEWDNASYTTEIGRPQLPVLRRLFVVPPGADVSVTYELGTATTLDLATTDLAQLVKPRQAPVPKLPGALEAAPFDFDAAAYAVNADWPAGRVIVEELGISRGQRLFMLEVQPVAYNPVAGAITMWPEINVEISFTGAQSADVLRNPLPGISNIVLNPDILPRVGLRGSGNYLIVCPSAFQSAIAPFAAAKQAQGFTVSTWVPSSATTTAIKSYIQSLWGTASEPEYVLLIGDTGDIPSWVGGGEGTPDTDIQYVCMDGSTDWYPDIALGRFPVDNTSELQTMIDKTLYYENGPLADPGYKKRAVFMAGDDNYSITEGTHNYVINNYMIPYGYSYDRVYEVTYGATTQDISNSFNAGRFYGIYSGHGGETSWADGPSFSVANVEALTNNYMFPMVCSFACVTGSYADNDECFMETWVLAENKGSVTAWGSSVNSYWDEDDILERVLFDAIFDNSDDVKTEIGPIYNEAKMRLLAHYGASATVRRYFEMYNLMGDPALLLPAACSDAGEISLDSGKYGCEDVVQITVTDCGLNLDDGVVDTAAITVVSDSEPAGEVVTLYETDAASAEFTGVLTVSGFNDTGVLLVAEGNSITATYIDADDGQGGTNVVLTAGATVDCTPPSISNIHVTNLEPRTVTIAFDATEPVVGTVDYGLACDALNDSTTGAGYSTSPVVNLSELMDGTLYYYKVRADDEAGNFVKDDNSGSCYTFTTPDVPDFFTELFTGATDLDNKGLSFNIVGGYEYYRGCSQDIAVLPTDPSGGTTLSLSDDGSATINLTGGRTVSLYGSNYSTFYVNANGNITFSSSDGDTSESLEDHFEQPRISGLFTDLNPASSGSVSWKLLADRVVVTWQNVPEYNTSNSNTFQIEMHTDGTITINYLNVDASGALAGLSEGAGIDPDFFMSDLSALGGCDPIPPRASNVSASTACEAPVTVTLSATDDGLPDPPAAMTFVVTSLPANGTLTDPNSGAIAAVPYTLASGGDQVIYTPGAGFHDADDFQFLANDGGEPPFGGDGNEAVVTVTVGGAAWDPVAYNVSASTGISVAVNVTLNGSDPNGDPLVYVIEQLPAYGYLADPAGGAIESVPYELLGGGRVVKYYPPCGLVMEDDFAYCVHDLTVASGNATASVVVNADDARLVYSYPMDTNPGWTTEGDWAFGQPTGGGTHNLDPTSGYTGDNVYGYNLAGDYARNIPVYALTTAALDCSNLTAVELRFRRWLGVEDGEFDQASIQVSADGSQWTTIWENPVDSAISESAWSLQTYDISAVADEQQTVYIRWTMGEADSSVQYPGWNIDDVEIWALVPPVAADFNGDGLVTLSDHAVFSGCLDGPEVLTSLDCMCIDLDADGDVDLADFAELQRAMVE